MTPPDQVPTYELVLDDEPDEREPSQPVAASWRRVIAIALAFSVGVALGVGGTVKQRDAADARQRAATLSLTAFSESWPDVGPDADHIQLSFRLLNNGPLPVHVESLALDVTGFALGDAQDRRFTVDPGEFVRTAATSGSTDCDGPPTRNETTVSARVTARLESGGTDDADVPIELLGFTMNDIWMISCQPPFLGGGFWADISGPAEIIETADGRVVSANLQLGFDLEEARILAVSGNEHIGLRMSASGALAPETSFVPVELVVRDCPDTDQLVPATTAGFAIEVAAGADQEERLELPIWDPAVLVALIEVIHLHCDDA